MAPIDRFRKTVQDYQEQHHGEAPAYVLLAPEEAEALISAVRAELELPEEAPLQSFEGVRIMPYIGVDAGEMVASDGLPGTGA